jgi:SpoVK/Ycf46/Vps4 family AAA+-type ATPase
VLVTLNRTNGVPPELLRPGRFDKIWATDLPDPEARLEILTIHLRKRGIDPERFGKALKSVVSVTENFSGAEIEEIVRAARCNAYHARMTDWEAAGSAPAQMPTMDACHPTVEELAAASREITPLAQLAADEVLATRQYCLSKGAAPVSGRRASTGDASARQRRVSGAAA